MYNVNIIMSVYNGEKYLREQIESIIKSTVPNWKLYIFDDGSTDESFNIAKEYAEKYKHEIFAAKNPHNMGSTASFLYNLYRVSNRSALLPSSHFDTTLLSESMARARSVWDIPFAFLDSRILPGIQLIIVLLLATGPTSFPASGFKREEKCRNRHHSWSREMSLFHL